MGDHYDRHEIEADRRKNGEPKSKPFERTLMEAAVRKVDEASIREFANDLRGMSREGIEHELEDVTRQIEQLGPWQEALVAALRSPGVLDAVLKEMGAAAREEDKPQPPAAAPTTLAEDTDGEKMSPLEELWYELQSQDWWHMMSDDPRVDRQGHQRLTEARAAADRLGDEGKAMFKAWEDHVKRGGPEVPLPQKS